MAQSSKTLLATLTLMIVSAAAATSATQASDWPHWRGPFFNGASDEKNLPSQWSTRENIAWSADLPTAPPPRPSCAETTSSWRAWMPPKIPFRQCVSIAIAANCSGSTTWPGNPKGQSQQLCLLLASGRRQAGGLLLRQWRPAVLQLGRQHAVEAKYPKGLRVVRFPVDLQQQSYALRRQVVPARAAARRGGPRVWFQGSRESFVSAGRRSAERQDPLASGSPSPAVAESRESFATAIPFEYKGQKQLLVAGGDVLSSHDPADGRELWRGGDYNPARVTHWRLVPSPVAGDGSCWSGPQT